MLLPLSFLFLVVSCEHVTIVSLGLFFVFVFFLSAAQDPIDEKSPEFSPKGIAAVSQDWAKPAPGSSVARMGGAATHRGAKTMVPVEARDFYTKSSELLQYRVPQAYVRTECISKLAKQIWKHTRKTKPRKKNAEPIRVHDGPSAFFF